MKKTFLYFLFLITTVGCAAMPTLKEVRSYPPTKTLAIPKETFCVYSKLFKMAIKIPIPAPWCTSVFAPWVSIWDPATESGEIFLGPREPYPVILFQVTKDKGTTIEAKIGSRGATGCTTENSSQQRISDILSSADFSSCPESPASDK